MSLAHRRRLRRLNALHIWCRIASRIVSRKMHAEDLARRAAMSTENRAAVQMLAILDLLPPSRVTITPKQEAKDRAWRA